MEPRTVKERRRRDYSVEFFDMSGPPFGRILVYRVPVSEPVGYRHRQTAFHLVANTRNQRPVFGFAGRRKRCDRMRPAAERVGTIAMQDMQQAGEDEGL